MGPTELLGDKQNHFQNPMPIKQDCEKCTIYVSLVTHISSTTMDSVYCQNQQTESVYCSHITILHKRKIN
jgi:hypothetical protein